MVITKEKVWDRLAQIPDPDIPVVSITDLGLVRDVDVNDNKVVVSVTPSYSGCPAMGLFKEEITIAMKEIGATETKIKTVFTPAWTTDWITEGAKIKMKKHGIAPPEKVHGDKSLIFSETNKKVDCPWCNSNDTKRTSDFGSTPCKALWFCNSCHQPFEYFKCM